MTNCQDIKKYQHAFVDDELDAVSSEAFAEHVRQCPSCAGEVKSLAELKQAIRTEAAYHPMPTELYQTILGQWVPSATPQRRMVPAKWISAGAGMALAASLALFLALRPDEEYVLEQQLLASHIHSLQDTHLIDVASSDRHTVKPWFNGKLDVAPPVIDLTAQGFILVGGRLDYVDHRAVAALVYRMNGSVHGHVINLFIWPGKGAGLAPETVAEQGYQLRHWQQGGLQFWAVTDASAERLAEFEKIYRSQSGQ